jgi:trimethylamine--corrinoid protein Co-methyltransferase
MGGLKLDDNQIALDAFREVGPGKHFFGCAHTLAHYETAFWDSAVADNNSFEQWRDEGEKDAPARASDRCKRLLAEYQQPKLDPAIDEELADFVRRGKAERPDQWH